MTARISNITELPRITLSWDEPIALNGSDYPTIKWEGPRHHPAFVSHRTYKWVKSARDRGDLPFPIKVIEIDPYSLDAVIVRTDAGSRLAALYWFLRYRLRRGWQRFTCRCVQTGMIWGLAYCDPGEMAHWRCFFRRRKRNEKHP